MTGDEELVVPPFDGTPRTIAIIKIAAKNLQRSLSLTTQASKFQDWADDNAERLHAHKFRLNKQKWTEFVNRPVSYVTKEPDLPRLAWHWLFEIHRHAIENVWLTAPQASTVIPNALIPTLHSFLSPKEQEPNLARLHDFQGDFAVYRPFFLDTDQIMVGAMACGVGDDISRFTIAMNFIDEDGEPTDEHVEGFMLPYQDSVLFQGWLKETASPFIFILSGFPTHAKTGKISKGDGTLLVGAGGTMSSAYPITIRRVPSSVTPATYNIESFEQAVSAHKSILGFMARGLVGWR